MKQLRVLVLKGNLIRPFDSSISALDKLLEVHLWMSDVEPISEERDQLKKWLPNTSLIFTPQYF